MNVFQKPFVKKATRRSLQRLTAIVGALALVAAMAPIQPARAAALTSVKDIMSGITAAANVNHTISFVAPSGVANNTTITVTFPTGFSLTGIIEDDTDIAGSTEGELTTAADCTGAEKAGVGISGQVITFTLCSGDGGDFTGSETITIEIGSNATSSGTGVNQIDNQSEAQNASDATIDLVAGASDSGSLAVEIIADDSVAVSATVDPSITFSISDVSIGFGTLSASTGRWATANEAGADASATTPTAAHTMGIATNAATGWAITYNGATLTSGGNTITDAAPIDEDSDGTPGTEQFGIGVSTDGNSTVASGYLRDSVADFDYVVSTTTTLISEIVATTTETISVSYLANILATTEPGTYTTSITYIATGTF